MPCGGCECVAEGGCMQGCCVGGRIGLKSQQCMERVTVSTKSTRVGHTARKVCVCVCVCCFLYVPVLGNQCTVPGFHRGEPRGHAPTMQNYRRETSTCLLQTTRGGRIRTLHLNSVAGYTGPPLFLFERTQELTPLTTRGKPWWLRV